MAEKNNPFDSYKEKNVGRTVQNVTSDMWEPISAGAPVGKDTPVRKKQPAPEKNASQSKKTGAERNKSAAKKQSSDVTRDRISEGGKNTQKKQPSKPSAEKKKNSPQKKKVAGTKKREPKGRDTRNIENRKAQAQQQRNRQRAKELNRSRLEYNEQLKSGRSHDDISKKRSRKKRKKTKLIAVITTVVMVLFVGGFIGAYAYTKGAPISVINIEGESRYKNEKIINAANLYTGLNMLSVREKAVNEAVTKALPYIASVEVDYQLPDTIVLKVTSTEEKILITNGTGYICVDENDKVVSLKKKKLTEGRYRLDGLEAQQATAGEAFVPEENNAEKYQKAKETVAVLESIEGFSKGVIDVTNLNDVRFTYDSRIRIYLGNCEKLESRLALAMEVIKEGANEGQTGYIDMRFGDKAYLALGSMEIK